MYIYVVERIVQYDPPGIISAPVLGVFTSKSKANLHMEAIKQDRLSHGSTLLYDRIMPYNCIISVCENIPKDIKRIEFEKHDNIHEILILRRYTIRKKK